MAGLASTGRSRPANVRPDAAPVSPNHPQPRAFYLTPEEPHPFLIAVTLTSSADSGLMLERGASSGAASMRVLGACSLDPGGHPVGEGSGRGALRRAGHSGCLAELGGDLAAATMQTAHDRPLLGAERPRGVPVGESDDVHRHDRLA